jgi:hypothetical protein
MKLHTGLVTVGLLSLGLFSYSCANGDTVSGTTGSGGSNPTGNGGSSSTGTGGTHTGGTTGTGTGGTHTGGVTGTGGIVTTGTGGTHTGGTTGTGGISSTGGITGTGGIVTTGTGGTTVSCPTTFMPTTGGYVLAPAHGGTCWHGYAYNFSDALGTTITPPTLNTYATCTTSCPLTAMGTVAAANAANSFATYAGIGFNINQDSSGGTAMPTLIPKGTGLTIAWTGTAPAMALRVQITDGTTRWCYSIAGASPVTIPYASFNTMCYDSPPDGTAYAMQPINAVQLQVAGQSTAGTYNIALTGVTEN